jgi:hypothetical protein
VLTNTIVEGTRAASAAVSTWPTADDRPRQRGKRERERSSWGLDGVKGGERGPTPCSRMCVRKCARAWESWCVCVCKRKREIEIERAERVREGGREIGTEIGREIGRESRVSERGREGERGREIGRDR